MMTCWQQVRSAIISLWLAACSGAAQAQVADTAPLPADAAGQPAALPAGAPVDPAPADAASTADEAPATRRAGASAEDEPKAVGATQRGQAVWYGDNWHGKATASGERFSKHKLTAAHRTLPMGATVRVTNDDNGKSVVVRINDRGPFGKRRYRIIDVSEAAARVLQIIKAGSCPVTIEVLSLPEKSTRAKKQKAKGR